MKADQPHRFQGSPYGNGCGLCFQARNFRAHQTWLWRVLNPGRKWRA